MLYVTLVPIKEVGDMGSLGKERWLVSGSCFQDSGDSNMPSVRREGTWARVLLSFKETVDLWLLQPGDPQLHAGN